ncbi:MAG: hypothetical protein ABIJ92_00545 [Candidatus Aenigmatarchaeota archaeon]
MFNFIIFISIFSLVLAMVFLLVHRSNKDRFTWHFWVIVIPAALLGNLLIEQETSGQLQMTRVYIELCSLMIPLTTFRLYRLRGHMLKRDWSESSIPEGYVRFLLGEGIYIAYINWLTWIAIFWIIWLFVGSGSSGDPMFAWNTSLYYPIVLTFLACVTTALLGAILSNREARGMARKIFG